MANIAQLDSSLVVADQKVVELDVEVPLAYSRYEAMLNGGKDAIITCADVSGGRGQQVTIPVFFKAGAQDVAAFNFDMTFPLNVTFVSVTPGQALNAAQKQIATNIVGGALRVLAFGINSNIVSSGPLLTVTFNINANAFPAFHTLCLFNMSLSTLAGTASRGFAVSGGLEIL